MTIAQKPSRLHRGISAAVAAVLICGLAYASPASATDQSPAPSKPSHAPAPASTRDVATDRFVVKFKEGQAGVADRKETYVQTAESTDVSVREVRTTATGAKIVEAGRDLTADETKEVAAALESDDSVLYAEPDILMRPASTGADPYFPKQWGLHDAHAGLNVSPAWDRTTGTGQVVAVIDTGITSHSDLDANILPGYDMISNATTARDGTGRDPDPRDEGDWYSAGQCGSDAGASGSSWHGTHVTGIIAALRNNAAGISGAAPGAKVVPVRALGSCGGYMSDIADSIIWAAGGTVAGVPANANPARVVNLSLGGGGSCSYTSQNAIAKANSLGAAVVVAAGNESENAAYSTPANCENVITVAASGKEGNKAAYSNFGANVDVTAPGGDMSYSAASGIVSTLNKGATTPGAEGYAYYQGTSMAAPHVSAVAALMLSVNPGLNPAQLEQRLKTSVRALPGTCPQGCGAGLVDAAAAVATAGQDAVEGTTPPAAPDPDQVLTAPVPAITGKPAVGNTLQAEPGTWGPDPVDLAYQWKRNGVPVYGATVASYPLAVADLGAVLTVTVTGSKVGYTAIARTSAPTAKIAPAEFAQGDTPSISGTATVGHALAADAGTLSPAPEKTTYQWYRSGAAISGATAARYTLAGTDLGHRIAVKVTATRHAYATVSRLSASTAQVAAGQMYSPTPSVSGTVKVGCTLKAASGSWNPGPVSLRYQWYRSGTAITGATGSSYVLGASDRGKTIQVKVTGTKAGYTSASRYSVATKAVATGTLAAALPVIDGSRKVGSTLTAKPGAWTPGTSFGYQWYRSGSLIKGATSRTYRPSSADVGKTIAVMVYGTKSGYSPALRLSMPTAKIAKGTLRTSAPAISGTKKAGYRLTAKAGTWTPGTTLRYQWYRSGKAIKGATAGTYKLVSADRHDTIKVRVAGTKAGYGSAVRYSASTPRIS